MSNIQQLKDALLNNLSGYVYDADDVEFRKAIEIDNGRVSLEPSLVVVPHVDLKGGSKAAKNQQIDSLI